jgi:alpha-L-fucosidase
VKQIKRETRDAYFTPPQLETLSSSESATDHSELLTGNLIDMGGSVSLQVGFEYRAISGEDVHARTEPWIATPLQTVRETGRFTYTLAAPPPGLYEFHAIVKHPLVTLYGADVRMQRK